MNFRNVALYMDVWSVLIIIGIAQGLFTLSVLLFKGKKSRRQHRYLLFIILLFIWLQAEFLSIRNVFNVPLNIFYGTRHGSWLALGPLLLFYLQSSTQVRWKLRIVHIIQFVPFALFTLVIPLVATDFLGFRQIHYGMLTVFDSWKEIITPFQYLYSYVFIGQFIHLGIYLLIGFGVVNKYQSDLKQDYAAIDQAVISWLKIFNVSMVAILLLATIFLLLFFFTDVYRRYLDYIYVLPMGVLTYLIAYKLSGVEFKKVSEIKVPITTDKYGKSSLKSNEVQSHKEALENIMKEDKPYLNNELRLDDLAEALDIQKYHLSQILNQYIDMSFFDFVNQHRVNEAKQLMVKEPRRTLLQIAYESGFNNKTSFVNAFKKFEGKTPSGYLKSLA